MHRFWMQRRLSRVCGGGRPPLPPQQLTVLAALLTVAVVAVSVMIVTGDLPWTAPGVSTTEQDSPARENRDISFFRVPSHENMSAWKECLAVLRDRWKNSGGGVYYSSSKPRLSFTSILPMCICKHNLYFIGLSIRVLLFMLLVVAGDVERNPGPLKNKTDDGDRWSNVADDILTEDDMYDVYEEVYTMAGDWRKIARGLKVTPHVVALLGAKHPHDPEECLSSLLQEWLKQSYDTDKYGYPSWRALVKAVASQSGGANPALAQQIAAKHPVNLVPEETNTTQNLSLTGAQEAPQEHTSPVHGEGSNVDAGVTVAIAQTAHQAEVYNPHSVQQVQAKIKEFECRFKSLKKTTRDGLACVNVKELVVHITDLQADDMPDHKVFLERKLKVLFKATDHYEVFGCLNLYWNYLAPGLLEHIIEEFSGEQVKSQMKVYKIDLHQFMSITPAKVFCQAQTKRSDLRPPPGFKELVIKFNWPESVCLLEVEKFRRRYTPSCNLRECAMMFVDIKACSFIVTWFVPESIVGILKKTMDENLFLEYDIITLQIAGDCIYKAPTTSKSASPGISTASTASPQSTLLDEAAISEDRFVEKLPDDIFCPVTLDVLLQPQLTSCCGKHLSEQAATRIQREKGACPLCKEPKWSTMPDKHFRSKVHELKAVCRYKEQGCQWEEKLGTLNRHEKSCKHRPSKMDLTSALNIEREGKEVFQQTAHSKLKLKWYTQKNTPDGMGKGAAVVHDNDIYCIPSWSQTLYRYCVKGDEWSICSQCPHRNTGLAIIKNILCAIGGEVKGEGEGEYSMTNKVAAWKDRKWVEEFPPMSAARWCHAVVGNDKYIIAAGGMDGETSVELFTVGVDVWSTVASLPCYLRDISATLGTGDVYVMAYDGRTYSVPLLALLANVSTDKPKELPSPQQWQTHSHCPVSGSTLCTLGGAILAIGGARGSIDTANTIYQLISGQWTEISHMDTPRLRPIVAVLPSNWVVVMGGYTISFCSDVEVAVPCQYV